MKSRNVLTKQRRIAALAEQMPELAFTSLNHHLDLEWMKEAYRRTRKDGAPGIDGQTAKEYEQDLEENLKALLDHAKSGKYRAPPVRRVHIPKGTGKETRPIGVPTLEDKVLQRAVTMVLEPIFEHDFSDSSYGFRPKRSAHQAMEAIWTHIMEIRGGWIIDADISKFFDTLDPAQLREFLQRRVRDGVIRRLIGKWLKAGVMEEGRITYPEAGTPQGGVVSPVLSNVYLHFVLDSWFTEQVLPRLTGRAFLVRYADDFVVICEFEGDARRIMEVLPKRFAKYSLTIHPEKTKLIDFRRPPRGQRGHSTFDFLGFTHYWGKSRKGNSVVRRKTAKKRLSRSLKAVNEWCKKHRHDPVRDQHRQLNMKLRGHYGYYGITGNGQSLAQYLYQVKRLWRKWLHRRCRKKAMPWPRFNRLLERWPLAPVRIIQSAYAKT